MLLGRFSELPMEFGYYLFVRLIDYLLESEQDINHSVLKENRQTGDYASFFIEHLPVLSLVENFDVWEGIGAGGRRGTRNDRRRKGEEGGGKEEGEGTEGEG